MPASKRMYGCDTGVAAKMHSMKDMFEAPQAKKRKRNVSSDSSSSDDIHQSKETEKRGTPLYHLARALDNMLSQAGLGGLATWIEENPPCRILSPTEYRYEAKDLPPFENHSAEVWQRWCVEDIATGKRRFEVPAETGEPFRPLLVAFTDECTAQILLLQGLAFGTWMRLCASAIPSIAY